MFLETTTYRCVCRNICIRNGCLFSGDSFYLRCKSYVRNFGGSYKPWTHPHPPSQKKVTLTHTHPHPAKKWSHSPTPTHIQPKKGHHHPHPSTSSQKKVTLTYTHLHPAIKRSRSPTLTHTQPRKGHKHPHTLHPAKKVTPIHTQPKKSSQTPTATHTQPKSGHTQSKKGYTHPHNWKKECHVTNTWYIREKYSLFAILAGVFILEKDWPVNFFILNTFETAFKSIVFLFVFNN